MLQNKIILLTDNYAEKTAKISEIEGENKQMRNICAKNNIIFKNLEKILIKFKK